MLTDRKRIEILLWPLFFGNIIECGVNDKDEEYHRCQSYLDKACSEALKGCDDKRKASLRRRAARVHNWITEDYRKNNVAVDKIGLVAFYTMNAILKNGYLELEEGTELAVALDAIVVALNHAFAEERLDASARKHAAKMLNLLQSMDYFPGVVFKKDAA
jgi:hypothetical protein